jgi:hypothetical protein
MPTCTAQTIEHVIREAVRKLCERFPGEYWRKLDASAPIRPNSSRR